MLGTGFGNWMLGSGCWELGFENWIFGNGMWLLKRWVLSGTHLRGGRLSTVVLSVLANLELVKLKLKILVTFVTKQANLMRRSVSFPWY
jgi:hypothetical protein